MNVETRETLDEYYAHAGSWADERTQSIYASRKTAWIIALVATVVALLLALTLIILLPLKTVVPHTILVDRQTGFVQAVDPANPQKLAPQKALTQSFLMQYVQAREGFDIATVQGQFRKVSLWTSGQAKNRYVSLMQATNPQSPLVIYPRNAVVDVQVRSVSLISDNTALVRFASIRREQGAAEQPEENWVAVIKFRYSSAPMTVEDRYINPLGFEVTDYRKDPESLVAEPSNISAAEVAPAPAIAGGTRAPLSRGVNTRQQ